MSKSDLIDITVCRHVETEKAVLVSDDGDKANAVWIPKSQCEIDEGQCGYVTITLPEWLALEKELI